MRDKSLSKPRGKQEKAAAASKLPQGKPGSESEGRMDGSSGDLKPRQPNRVDLFFRVLGPGLITGCADDDPSGISTYAIAGAAFGYATLLDRPALLPR